MIPTLVNTLWQLSGWRASRHFHRSIRDVSGTQNELLSGYLQANSDTEFGRRHDFAAISSVEEYRRRVPLTSYADYTDYIARLAAGEQGVLTSQRVRLFEPTSGSTAGTKLIPYTATLRAEFQRGLAPWIGDLFSRRPGLRHGPAYWSVTPLTDGARLTPGGTPIGFEDDSAYLGPLGALVAAALAVPSRVKEIADIDGFRYVTLLFLLRADGLRLISIWNPTYLLLLLEPARAWWERLCTDIEQGTLSPPAPLAPRTAAALRRRLSPAPHRAARLRAVGPDDYAALWPRLELISAWADGPAAAHARRLEARLPEVHLQPKGLLATEAMVSFPLFDHPGAVLALTSHFFEFLPEDRPDGTRLAHELERGQCYSVVVTTGGGLYRYRLHDLVEVVGHLDQAPLLRFIGKSDHISDWFGEKLSEPFVAGVVQRLLSEFRLDARFAMLAPADDADGFRYMLYLELVGTLGGEEQQAIEAALDEELRRNFHYAYCRKLGQLAPARIYPVAGDGAATYLRACQARGQRLGEIKPTMLQRTTGWSEWFRHVDVPRPARRETRP